MLGVGGGLDESQMALETAAALVIFRSIVPRRRLQFWEPVPKVPVVGLELESFLHRLREPFRWILMIAPKIKGSKTSGSDPAISIVVVEPADPGREPISIERS